MKIKKPTIFIIIVNIIILTVINGCFNDNNLWDKTYDATKEWDRASAITIDPSGDIYVAGYGTGLQGPAGRDWWIIKFKPNGDEYSNNWNVIYGKPVQDDDVLSIVADDNGNIYAVGYVNNFIDPEHGWIKKFDSNGIEDIKNWNKTFSSKSLGDRLISVAYDQDDNIFVIGSRVIQKEMGGVRNVKTIMLIKKFDPNGNEDTINWNKTYDIQYSFVPSSLALDNNNNVYITGKKVVNIDYKVGEILKYNSNGTLMWIKSYDWLLFDGHSSSVTTDKFGDIYIVGHYYYNATVPATSDWWIKKFDTNGNEDTIQWNKIFDGNGGHDYLYSVVTDNDGNVYVAGNGFNLIGSTGMDWWIKKFDSQGNELWDKRYDGNKGFDVPYSIAVDNSGNVFVAGGGSDFNGNSQLDWWIKKIV